MDVDSAIASKFIRFANDVVGRSPVLKRLALASATSRPVIRCLAGVSVDQQSVYLLFVAIQFILWRSGDVHALGRILRSSSPDHAGATELHDVRKTLEDFVEAHGHEIRDLMETRSVQLNEVGRASSIWLALLASGPGPVTLVEIGASMGLNLHYDQYAFRWSCGDEARCVLGGHRTSPVDIRVDVSAGACADLMKFISLSRPPTIVARLGIDRQPRSIRDEDDRQWVRFAIWPDDRERLERFDKACELMATHEAPRIVRGDAVDDLIETIGDALVPGSEVCIVHTATVGWMPASKQLAFYEAVAKLSRMVPVRWVSCERYGASPVREQAPGGDVRAHEPVLVGLSRLTANGRQDDVIARVGMHNEWMEWNARERSKAGAQPQMAC